MTTRRTPAATVDGHKAQWCATPPRSRAGKEKDGCDTRPEDKQAARRLRGGGCDAQGGRRRKAARCRHAQAIVTRRYRHTGIVKRRYRHTGIVTARYCQGQLSIVTPGYRHGPPLGTPGTPRYVVRSGPLNHLTGETLSPVDARGQSTQEQHTSAAAAVRGEVSGVALSSAFGTRCALRLARCPPRVLSWLRLLP